MKVPYTEYKNKYGKYCVPDKHENPASRAIRSGNIFEPNTIKFIIENVEGDMIHAGTYFGDMIPVFAKHANKVWAFEPSPINFYCAQKTTELNDVENIELQNFALSDTSGQSLQFVIKRNNKFLGGMSRILKAEKSDSMETVQVKTIRIDEVIPDSSNISIIQLDVEGHEFEALKGGAETIKRCRPIIIFEVNSDTPHNELKSWLNDLGYEFKMHVHKNEVWKPINK